MVHPGGGRYTASGRREIPDPAGDETFDSAFLSELEGLVTGSELKVSEVAAGGDSARGYRETLAAFLAPLTPGGAPLSESAFLELPESVLGERGTALVERRKEYIEAARCLALSDTRIVFRHLLPNCMPPLIVVGTVQVAHAIALEATLSFLGIGLPITEPSLGLLIANGFEYLLSGKYWISFFPGVALLITIVSINLVGDQLRDVLNPRLQK